MTMRFIISLAALAALAGLPACSSPPDEQAGSDPIAPPSVDALAIKTAIVREITDIPLGSVPGRITLSPEARVAVTAPFPGAAMRIYVIEGQRVERGEPLALVRAAQPVQIRAEVTRARIATSLAEARAGRLSQLAKEGIIAMARADEATAQFEQARASLSEASRLATLGAVGADGTMTLKAPIRGRVAHVGVESGGGVDGMTAPFVIEADGAYQIELQLPERLAREVQPGMQVEIALGAADRLAAEGTDGAGGPMQAGGQIIAVAPSIDPATRSVMARASIGAGPSVIAGRNVSVTIKGQGRGLTIPERAVTRISGSDHVFVRERTGASKVERWRPRPVIVAMRSGGMAIIADGLVAGETVATSSVAELKAMSAQ